MSDIIKERIAKYNFWFWRYVFIIIILFWKDPDIVDALIYWLTK